MKGVWMTRNEVMQIRGLSLRYFDKTLAHELKSKFEGARKKYFLPLSMMPQNAKDTYKDMVIELDDEAQEVEDVLGDVSTGLDLDADLKTARLDKLKVDTALAQQKLEEQKQEIWSDWNAEFFECFSDAFTKFKNELISLHLDKEKLEVLTEKLEDALSLLKDQLDAMWTRYMAETKEEAKED